jgi:hypothetical protein
MILKFGEFAGEHTSLTSNSSCLAVSKNNLSFGDTYGGALSRCMYIGLSMSSHNHLAWIADRTLLIKNSWLMPFLIESKGFISIVLAHHFLLDLLAPS